MKLNIILDNSIDSKNIAGIQNQNLKVLEELFDVQIDIHGDSILTDTTDCIKIAKLEDIFRILLLMSSLSQAITARDIIYIESIVSSGKMEAYQEFLKSRKPICHNVKNKPIFAKTLKQAEYIDCIKKHDLVFSIGAAGTGKTYLAVCYAVSELKKGSFEKIILTRPAVEAGESLGFLPGDLKEKVDPYLRPLYDALYDMLGKDGAEGLIEKQVIEIAPLAYMRGRTLENAFIILDEAQNATIDQLKMFLTRLGFNSKMVITGDISQVDLPSSKKSGLKLSRDILQDINEVGSITFDHYDVVRHPLVGKIIEKFEQLK